MHLNKEVWLSFLQSCLSDSLHVHIKIVENLEVEGLGQIRFATRMS